MARLDISRLVKSFDRTTILHGIDLAIHDGEFMVFVGPSGCGKSTLLRTISGLEAATSGNIEIDGQNVNHVSAANRGCAMVFQSYALYPHMTVFDNMAFGLENMGVPRPEILSKVQAAAELLRLHELLQRKPTQLSGGQRQRVAIGRAIVRSPKVFLFDEPLSNLDAELRVSMRSELRELHGRLKATMIYVTHDQVEAMTMADRIVVYNRPANTFVAGFIGSPRMNFFPADILRTASQHAPGAQSVAAEALPAGLHTVGLRPEHVEISDHGALELQVTQVEQMGASSLLRGKLAGASSFEVLANGQTQVAAGQTVRIGLRQEALHFFNADGQRI